MTFCDKCVKIFVLFTSGTIIICGLTLLIVTLTALNLDDYVPSDDFHDWMGTLKLALIILSIILLEIGLLGIFSAWKQNKCVIFLFQIQITIFSLIFLAVGVVSLVLYQSVIKDISCSNLDVLDDASLVISKSSNLLCTQQCPCNCEDSTVYAMLSASRGNSFVHSSSGVKRVQDCATFSSVVGSYDVITKALGKVEEKFDCSGLCSINNIYLFSDINHGIPKNQCIEKVLNEMKKLLRIIAGIGLAIGFLKFITVWVACFLCCKARKRAKIDNEYNNVGKQQEMMETPYQPQPQQQYY